MAILSHKHRLYPNRAQAEAMHGMLGAFCDLYNAALQQRIEAYRRRGLTLRYGQQAVELKAVRVGELKLLSSAQRLPSRRVRVRLDW